MDENNEFTDGLEEEEFDELENTIVLTDENGNEIEFEFIDSLEVDGQTYNVLLPMTEAETGEVVIFKVDVDGDDATWTSIEEEEAMKVFQIFKERKKDEWDFAD